MLIIAGIIKQQNDPKREPISPITKPTSSSVHWVAMAVIEHSMTIMIIFWRWTSVSTFDFSRPVSLNLEKKVERAGKNAFLKPANIKGYPHRMAKPVAALARVAKGSSDLW
mmetsp:Transcript_3455/g.4867  ORF Transcript_3455/g.4867 Transcript_3455/m.4867 type:complete len:111 (-) Transcript_3455:726-1058(-)